MDKDEDEDDAGAADDDEDDAGAGAGAGALCSLHRALWSMCYAFSIGQCVPEALHLLLRLQQEQQEADAISSSFASFLMCTMGFHGKARRSEGEGGTIKKTS